MFAAPSRTTLRTRPGASRRKRRTRVRKAGTGAGAGTGGRPGRSCDTPRSGSTAWAKRVVGMRMSSLPSFDGCEAVEKIATGPIVEVYRATQVTLGRRVTIKALAASVVPSSPFAAALEREARLLAQL